MHRHDVRPGQAFAGQKVKFTGHLSDDRLLFAGLRSVFGTHAKAESVPKDLRAIVKQSKIPGGVCVDHKSWHVVMTKLRDFLTWKQVVIIMYIDIVYM